MVAKARVYLQKMEAVLLASHPIAFASYPVLALYVASLGQLGLDAIVRSWAASVLLAILLIAAFRWWMPGRGHADLAASLCLLVFFSYGHIYAQLKQLGAWGPILIRHRYLAPLAIALAVGGLWLIRKSSSIRPVTVVAGTVGWSLVLALALRAGTYALESYQITTGLTAQGPTCTLDPPPNSRLPDVYVIIMDAYERDDILWEMHGYDNTPFLRALESRGFYVARGSMANYRHTELSIPSLLNMEYVQNLPGSHSPESTNTSGMIELLKNSRLRRELECLSYATVAIETGVVWSEWRDADYFISREAGVLYRLQFAGGLTRFESLLLRTTIARALLDLTTRMGVPPDALANDPVDVHRERILFQFEQLKTIPELPGPKLVFAHILSPHPPMVFGPNGEYVDEATFETDATDQQFGSPLLKAYADQVHYLNGRLLEVVRAILAKSASPPVIIIQGDHGWADRNAEDKLSILNVYHFPDADYSALYPTITPVNSFRVVLNQYLGGSFELLEDVSYFSTEEAVFQFEVVPNSWRESP